MSENISAPYIIQISEPFPSIRLTEELNKLGLQIDPTPQDLTTFSAISTPQIIVEPTHNLAQIIQEAPEPMPQNLGVMQQEHPCIVQIVYPHDLQLCAPQNFLKRGRPKKKKPEEIQEEIQAGGNLITCKNEVDSSPPKTARTRSGRLVKLPKYIEKDFKKIEVTTVKQEIQVSDFKRCEKKENPKIEFAALQTKKRVISSQYKCPKCCKVYLGKNRMIQHLKKYPDHGPLPEGYQEFNFDVWNYLFDITQKCKSGQRGIKFCEELSNLLHNVQLLKSALFKTVTDNKNCVHIDKVLGNAIGLPPGKYKFDENELYKDVTVLKLITNSDFFKPNVNKQAGDTTVAKNKGIDEPLIELVENNELKPNIPPVDENFSVIDAGHDANKVCHIVDSSTDDVIKENKHDENIYDFSSKPDQSDASKMQENVIADSFTKKMDVDSQILPSDLLSENLLLHSLPNPRNSVDELMLTSVDNSSNLLDNSTSSDEVMNVDQFVNERFKKIIGPDMELSNASLNLDLPSLELFQFHTS